MIGMDRHTGALISGQSYLVQRVQDVVTTRVGTRIIRRQYGGSLPDLVDRKVVPATFTRAAAAIAATLMQWVPDFKIRRISWLQLQPGQVIAVLSGTERATGQPLSVEVAL